MIPTISKRPDFHAVFVTLADHTKHRLTDWTDWAQAIDLWTALDDQRLDALKAKGVWKEGETR